MREGCDGETSREAHARASHRADVVTARSCGPPAVVAECGAPLLRVGGRLLVSEPPQVTDRWPVEGLAALGLSAPESRALDGYGFVGVTQSTPCAVTYPRKPGVPERSPLF